MGPRRGEGLRRKEAAFEERGIRRVGNGEKEEKSSEKETSQEENSGQEEENSSEEKENRQEEKDCEEEALMVRARPECVEAGQEFLR